ncbi:MULTISPECIES: DNA-binding protein WhiA [unclassified Enterococcus]|uniref:DNA-binding protein WhiA n=1 Tax=unclassified Enterococcus TaxID=2608891 RepID=UPI0015549CC1|nr:MULTISPECIES: DNA-binding protein WhiA [unclassified Enterococcus]MBS7576240.1 DNA-binding protein WhiA [Enterococcus sp. MMGLQ5-2]MBS7583473.1 DNA-binding protein WhiA [Enterococcus sp. MMGLQ5-1]NPD11333.1 DNA-binding protein WhiA [Enterococcus sp. MMGLQ5-1]NPD36076.1 DNA-binding protein WhiA [Enterococcus sp. MMGLQ5-2]
MSFSTEVKKELSQIETSGEQARAELSALIRMLGSINLSNKGLSLVMQTQNSVVARRIFSLIKQIYGLKSQLIVQTRSQFGRHHVYQVQVGDASTELLNDLEILDGLAFKIGVADAIKKSTNNIRAYLRGVFLASGSVRNPEKSQYHLELFSVYDEQAVDLLEMLEVIGIKGKQFEKKNGTIVYLKNSADISEFLLFTGATKAMLQVENAKIIKEIKRDVNRKLNFETANMNRTVDASSRQIEMILEMKANGTFNQLSEKIQEIAELRLKFPEKSVAEIAQVLGLTKSAANHRFRKLIQIYDERHTK